MTVASTTVQTARRQWFAFALLCLTQFMVVLDAAVVNVALPSMQHDLGMSTQTLQWVVSAYSLTFGCFLLLSGRAGDLFGRRRLLMAGLTIFSLASLAGGFAQSGIWFITTRAIQGIGATLVAPTTLSLTATIFAEGPERNRAFGIIGSISSSAFAIGALLGGLLVAGPGWRWVMFINVPIGIMAIALAPVLLRESGAQTERRHIDVPGAIIISIGLIALVAGLGEGNVLGWVSWQTISLFVLALVLILAFVRVELRSPAPLVRFGIFRLGTLRGADLVALLAPAALVSLLFMLTLYMQRVLGYSAINTGLAFLPMALAIMATSNLSSRLAARVGVKNLLVGGTVILTLGLLMFTRISVAGTFLGTLLPAMLITAIGLGCVFPAMVIAGTAGVSNNEQGLAAGLINTGQQVGAAIGLAITTTIATSHTAALLRIGVSNGAALVGGFQTAIFACAAFALAAALIVVLIIRERECAQGLANPALAEHCHSIRPFAIHIPRGFFS
jgi:EmrB/QacA subfamily drug resistance transporter